LINERKILYLDMFNLNLFVISRNSFHSFILKKFTQKTEKVKNLKVFFLTRHFIHSFEIRKFKIRNSNLNIFNKSFLPEIKIPCIFSSSFMSIFPQFPRRFLQKPDSFREITCKKYREFQKELRRFDA
jgi:GTP-sensing pleiotropic transcriptional regulator CodY